jgi:hypothetical protein
MWLSEQIDQKGVLSRHDYHLIHHHNWVNGIGHQPCWWSQGCGLIENYSPLVVVHVWQSYGLCDEGVDSIPGFYGPSGL